MFVGSLLAVPTAVRAQDDPLDLAATIIHPDDLDWIVAEQELQGQLDDAPYITDVSLHLTTVDEVLASPWYLWGRGGFLPSASGSVDLSDLLQESGWVRTMDAFMVRLANIEDSWLTGVGVSIEEYESSEGAEQAFAAFNDEQTLAEIAQADDVDALDAPDLGAEAAMWSIESTFLGAPSIPVVSYWVRVENLVVSVSAFDASEITEPDPAVVERLMELQLKRLEHAEHLYQPNLTACAPRLAGDEVTTLSNDYVLLNGKAFGVWEDTYPVLAEDEATSADNGMVDRHRLRQRIANTDAGVTDGLLYYTVFTRAFVDDDHAADYIDTVDSVLEDEGRAELAELDDVPDLGDASRAFTYVGNSGSPSVTVYVQIGSLVFSVYLGPSTEPLSEPAYDLAAAYSDRLADGDCDAPLDAPTDL